MFLLFKKKLIERCESGLNSTIKNLSDRKNFILQKNFPLKFASDVQILLQHRFSIMKVFGKFTVFDYCRRKNCEKKVFSFMKTVKMEITEDEFEQTC